MSGWRRLMASAALGLAVLALLSGCGKRGDLDAPLGQEDTSKRVYPAQ